MMDGGSSWEDQSKARRHLTKRRKLGLKFPSTKQELLALSAASTKPITKLPPGVSRDWIPSWLRPSNRSLYEKVTDEVQTPELRIKSELL